MCKLVILNLFFALTAWAQTELPVNISRIDTIYVPHGFDSNDQVQFVVEGTYRDTCSKPAGTRFTVNPSSKVIQVSAHEYRYAGPCLDVLVQHDEVVNLGIVPAGNYQIVMSEGSSLGRLDVKFATKSLPDDYLYAPISQAYLKKTNGKLSLTLSGVFTNSCMKIQKVISSVKNNVIAVQPLATPPKSSEQCNQGRFPFEHSTYIEAPKSGRYLLHVRSLNGKAINNLFDL